MSGLPAPLDCTSWQTERGRAASRDGGETVVTQTSPAPASTSRSDVTQTPEYTAGRDRFLASQRGGETLLAIRKSMHLGFTDDPSYLTSLGRDLLGAAGGMGSISLADMTTTTGDAISAFVAPSLGVRAERSVEEVVAGHPSIRSESRVRRETAVAGATSAAHAVPPGESAMRR